MDCSVVAIGDQPGNFLVSTTDFFYPLVKDPYRQGRIAACNVLSDIYAMGVTDVDTMLMILSASLQMKPKERDIVTTQIIRGFADVAREAGTSVTGGQTVLNPWPITGGTATRSCTEEQMIRPVHAVPGDAVVLTKPLGTQVAVNALQWVESRCEKDRARVDGVLSTEDVFAAFDTADESMGRLNRNAARMMHKHGAHAATDVTGFGILGHASNLAASQHAAVDVVVETLPIIRGMRALNDHNGNLFKLLDGTSAETSGGLLICVPAANAEALIAELQALDSAPAWVVGRVEEGTGRARIADDVRVVEV